MASQSRTLSNWTTTNRNELSCHEKTWRNLKCLLPNERNQCKKATYCVTPTLWHSGKHKNYGHSKRSVVDRVRGGRVKDRQHREFLEQWSCSVYCWYVHVIMGFPGGSEVNNLPANADVGLNPGVERSPGEGNGSPLQYSCLRNPMDRGAWWTTVHGVTELDRT